MIGKYILCAAIAASTFNIQGSDSVDSEYYPEIDDTTSFNNAYEFTYGDEGQQYSENYSTMDNYDYIKYTATYSRMVCIALYASNGKVATAEAYLGSIGFNTVVQTYSSNDSFPTSTSKLVFLKQGDTIYFKVRCTGTCNWVSTMFLNRSNSDAEFVTYDRMYGYQMPKSGMAYVYYNVDESFTANVPNQNFTYEDCVRDAMDVWQTIGGVTFVKDPLRAVFTCKATNRDDLLLAYKQYNITLNTVLGTFEVPNKLDFYQDINAEYGNTTWDGIPLTIRQAVTGAMVYSCGYALGLCPRRDEGTENNMMYYIIHPFTGVLGDGDIDSFIHLWGDRNKYDAEHANDE